MGGRLEDITYKGGEKEMRNYAPPKWSKITKTLFTSAYYNYTLAFFFFFNKNKNKILLHCLKFPPLSNLIG